MEKPTYWEGITEEEWKECVTLEYVLTQCYSKNIDQDYERYTYLQNKKIYNTDDK